MSNPDYYQKIKDVIAKTDNYCRLQEYKIQIEAMLQKKLDAITGLLTAMLKKQILMIAYAAAPTVKPVAMAYWAVEVQEMAKKIQEIQATIQEVQTAMVEIPAAIASKLASLTPPPGGCAEIAFKGKI